MYKRKCVGKKSHFFESFIFTGNMVYDKEHLWVVLLLVRHVENSAKIHKIFNKYDFPNIAGEDGVKCIWITGASENSMTTFLN